jgi:two-component system, OmpR family, KDP operon response regulator KdpE
MNETEKKQSVLVVDDQPKVLRFIEINLKLHGFEVISTTSGQEALDLVKSTKPDIMLLDLIMPGIDGFELLKELRTFSDLPVIAISASPGNYDSAMQLGANDFVPKPFKADEMIGRIKKLLRGYEITWVVQDAVLHTGSANKKVEPRPRSESTLIHPP